MAGVEVATKISELVATNPPGSDPKSEGDNHLRLIKGVLQDVFDDSGTTIKTTLPVESPGGAKINGDLNVTGAFTTSGLATAASLEVNGVAHIDGDLSGDLSGNFKTLTTETSFVARTAAAVVAATGAGSVYLRPNGVAVTDGQFALNAIGTLSGKAISVTGDIGANGLIFAGGNIVATGNMQLSQNLQSTLASLVLGAVGGNIYFRPQGATSSVNENYVSAAGRVLTRGLNCRTGEGGAWSANCFNTYWNGSGIGAYIDNTLVGIMAMQCDYRVKKDIADLPSTWEKVKALRPISYTAAEFGIYQASDEPQWGLVAHEVQETLLRSAASGEKDGEDVQQLNLIPIVAALTSALQEAMERIEDLEAGMISRETSV